MTVDCSHMVLNIDILKTSTCRQSHGLLAPNTRNYAKAEDWSSQCFWTLPLLLVLWGILYNECNYLHPYFCFKKAISINVILKMISMFTSKEKLSQLFYWKELGNWSLKEGKPERHKAGDGSVIVNAWCFPEDISSDPSTHIDSQPL